MKECRSQKKYKSGIYEISLKKEAIVVAGTSTEDTRWT